MSDIQYNRVNLGHIVFEATNNVFKKISNYRLPTQNEIVLGKGTCVMVPTSNPGVFIVYAKKVNASGLVKVLTLYADGRVKPAKEPVDLDFTLAEDKTITVTRCDSNTEEIIVVRAKSKVYEEIPSTVTTTAANNDQPIESEPSSEEKDYSDRSESSGSEIRKISESEHDENAHGHEIDYSYIDFSEDSEYEALKSYGKHRPSDETKEEFVNIDEIASRYNNKAGLGYHVEVEEYIAEEPSEDDYTPTWKSNDIPKWISSNSSKLVSLLPTDVELVDNDIMNFANHSFDEFDTIDIELVHKILKSKSWFDKLYTTNPRRFISARCRSNPYEDLGTHIFLSRSSLKAAAIDASCHITDYFRNRPEAAQIEAPMLVLDISNGTSPFAEYFLWKLKPRKVIIFSQIIKENKYTPSNYQRFNCWNERTLKSAKYSFRLLNGSSNDGDIRTVPNIHAYKNSVFNANIGHSKASVKGYGGVDLVCADASSIEQKDFNRQELVARQLILSEVIFMLHTLRSQGDFILKIYDCFTAFTTDIVYLLYLLFDKITIVKPPVSRAANSEKYIICKGFRSNTGNRSNLDDLILYLEKILNALADPKYQLPENDDDDFRTISNFIDRSKIKEDHDFITYLRYQNNRLAKMQKSSLRRIQRCVVDSSVSYNSSQMVRDCLKSFDLPRMTSNAERINSYKFIIEGTSKNVESLWLRERFTTQERQPVDRRSVRKDE